MALTFLQKCPSIFFSIPGNVEICRLATKISSAFHCHHSTFLPNKMSVAQLAFFLVGQLADHVSVTSSWLETHIVNDEG